MDMVKEGFQYKFMLNFVERLYSNPSHRAINELYAFLAHSSLPIDPEGYFHTGDIGVVDAQGFLRITDRKKEMWKTSGGKYIAPQVIENKLKESPFIEQVIVVGDNEKFPGALIVPAFANLYDWLDSEGINAPRDMPAAVVAMDKVKAKITEEVERLNESFGKWEQIKKFELLPRDMTIDSGELTPTMKPKRKFINEKYKAEIEKIYAN